MKNSDCIKEEFSETVRNKLIQIYSADKLWFPLILSVIEQNQAGRIFVNNNDYPTHAFIVNKFGFCQEAFEEYDDYFFEHVIQPFIESKDRMKLRMYHPGKQMKQYLSTLSGAAEARRVHMMHTDTKVSEGSAVKFVIKDVSKEDVQRDDFGLSLAVRYYADADDFMRQAKALGAYTNDGEMIGIVYSAGEALGVCEKDIYVVSEFRGQGIGKKLTECFIEKCREDHKLVSEDIYGNNDASVALAKATGAQMVGEYEYFNIEVLEDKLL